MAECNHDCSNCSSKCSKESFIERNCEDLIANTIVEKYPEKIIGIYLDVDDDKVTIKTL